MLQNTSLTVDFDRIIAGGEVLVVKGALGAVGAGNTSVLMQLLIGHARRRARTPAGRRAAPSSESAVALKIDEAPLVINRGFAQTMALKRSAGPRDGGVLADRRPVDRPRRAPPARRAVRPPRLLRHRLGRGRPGGDRPLMAAYSDQVRGVDHGLPIARQPRRASAPAQALRDLASWVTAEGRQPPFIAADVPARGRRRAHRRHHRRQHERGGRELESFHQPHWDRDDQDAVSATVPQEPLVTRAPNGPGRATHRSDPTGEREHDDFAELRELLRSEASMRRPATAPPPAREHQSPRPFGTPLRNDVATTVPPPTGEAPATYAELVVVDEATRVTWPRKTEHRTVQADATDLELLAWLTELRFALATQTHRRFGGGKSYSTTQRRLKKLSQAGWVERFPFFRETGASSALTYLVTKEGIATVKDAVGSHGPYLDPRREWSPPSTEDPAMRGARHDLHVNAWVLALESQLNETVQRIRGPRNSYVAAPFHTREGQRCAIGPGPAAPAGRTHAARLLAHRPRAPTGGGRAVRRHRSRRDHRAARTRREPPRGLRSLRRA